MHFLEREASKRRATQRQGRERGKGGREAREGGKNIEATVENILQLQIYKYKYVMYEMSKV